MLIVDVGDVADDGNDGAMLLKVRLLMDSMSIAVRVSSRQAHRVGLRSTMAECQLSTSWSMTPMNSMNECKELVATSVD